MQLELIIDQIIIIHNHIITIHTQPIITTIITTIHTIRKKLSNYWKVFILVGVILFMKTFIQSLLIYFIYQN